MRYTKALREYVNIELTKKRQEADDKDELTITYRENKKRAIAEIKEIVEKANVEATAILEKYGLENTASSRWLSEENIIHCYNNNIGNIKEAEAQKERESARYQAQRNAEREIEISCTLGASKEEFMEMISAVSF